MQTTTTTATTTTATRHTCGGPVFGKLAPAGECARCDELRGGAAARRPAWTLTRRTADAQRVREIRAHDCRLSGCGIVCTFGDW